jgi:hypothetical protein
MLQLAIACLAIALIAGLFGFGVISSSFMAGAKTFSSSSSFCPSWEALSDGALSGDSVHGEASLQP